MIYLTGEIDFLASGLALPSYDGELNVSNALYGWASRGGTYIVMLRMRHFVSTCVFVLDDELANCANYFLITSHVLST